MEHLVIVPFEGASKNHEAEEEVLNVSGVCLQLCFVPCLSDWNGYGKLKYQRAKKTSEL